MRQGRYRLIDVARRAGVSLTTASFVMTGQDERHRISPATRDRVRHAAEELGYRPGLAARNPGTRPSRIVGLVSDTIAAEPYAGEFVRGALAAALAHDHLLVIAETDGDRRTEDDLLRGMADRRVDGLVYATLFTRTVELPPAAAQYPVVLLNCLTDPVPGPAVIPDVVGGGLAGARALLDAGHRD
ncbi:MAG: LacI family DNA-binding transcriptional regulator, partial [Pseudonocardia sp.]